MRILVALRSACVLGPVLFVAFLALCTALPISLPGIPLELQKGIFAASASALFLLLTALAIAFHPSCIRLPRSALFLTLAPLLFVASVSALLSERSLWGLFGAGFEFGTWGSFLLFSIAVGAGALLAAGHRSVCARIYIDATALSVVAMLGVFALWGGASLAVLGDAWPLFSFAIAGALLLQAATSDARLFGSRPLSTLTLLILLGGFFFFFHLAAAISLLIGCSVCILLAYFFGGEQGARIQWHVLAVLAVVLGLALTGVRDPIPTLLPDIRPTFSGTERVVASHFMSGNIRALFGVGPGEFVRVWEQYRPIALNSSPIAEETFSAGYNSVLTLLTEIGFLGVLAFFFPLCIVGFRLIQTRQRGGTGAVGVGHFEVMLASVCVFAYTSALLYQVPLLLLLLCGAFLGMHVRDTTGENVSVLTLPLLVRSIVGILIFCAALFLLRVSIQQGVSLHAYTEGTEVFSIGQYSSAVESFERALGLWPLPLYYRDASRALLSSALRDSDSSAPLSDVQKEDIGKAVTYSWSAIAYDPRDYWSWISRGSLLVSLVNRGFLEQAEDARESLMQAQSLAPSRPEAAYLLAVLALRQGDLSEARVHIERVFALSPGYADAVALQRVLDAAQ